MQGMSRTGSCGSWLLETGMRICEGGLSMAEFILAVGYGPDEFKESREMGAANGTVCDCAGSPDELERLAQERRYDSIICDRSVLDYVPYIHALRKIRATPILIGTMDECIGGMFNRQVSPTGKTAATPQFEPLKAGDLRLYPEYRLVSIQEREISLTTKEFDILSLLVKNPKRVFSYEMIVDLVWHENYTACSRRTISNHVSNIRKKLLDVSDAHEYIVSVYGIGYKLAPDL